MLPDIARDQRVHDVVTDGQPAPVDPGAHRYDARHRFDLGDDLVQEVAVV